MRQNNTWLLPEGIEEILPEEANCLENLRRLLLDVFGVWGYQLVIPPFIDFLDSLLIGSGHDLELQTFKLTDQLSGQMLGVRADITPQVARIDAHHFQTDQPARLCYYGTVLHTRGDPLEKTRSPIQIGAELYGHSGVDSDLEVIELMLEALAVAGILNVHLDLGHVGIYRSLSQLANLNAGQESQLFDVLQRKARPELEEFLNNYALDSDVKAMIMALPLLNGGAEVLTKARQVFANASSELGSALDNLEAVARQLGQRFPALPISFDLAELRGYHYHTGIVFAAFIPEIGREIARGGRYDNIGRAFGRSRPATGFSADLKQLATLGGKYNPNGDFKIFAPWADDVILAGVVRDLRAAGRTVIQELPGQTGNAIAMGCASVLEKDGQDWIVRTIA